MTVKLEWPPTADSLRSELRHARSDRSIVFIPHVSDPQELFAHIHSVAARGGGYVVIGLDRYPYFAKRSRLSDSDVQALLDRFPPGRVSTYHDIAFIEGYVEGYIVVVRVSANPDRPWWYSRFDGPTYPSLAAFRQAREGQTCQTGQDSLDGNTSLSAMSVISAPTGRETKDLFLPGAIVIGQLTWQVLPPGEWDRWLEPVPKTSGTRRRTGGWRDDLQRERLEFVRYELGRPRELWFGEQLASRNYWVAIFERVAIADSPKYGNALFYCDPDKWQTVFKISKQETLSAGATRIVHAGDWKGRVRRLAHRDA